MYKGLIDVNFYFCVFQFRGEKKIKVKVVVRNSLEDKFYFV